LSVELERAAAGVLLPSFEGLTAPAWLEPWLDGGLCGVVLFARNVRDTGQLRDLTLELRGRRPELLVGIDEEGGDVTRLEVATGSSYPGNHALGAVDDVELTREVAAAIGADLVAAGVNVDFAPVADVNTNPDNPIIGIRSFSDDAAVVARHVAAFVTGLQSVGVAACAKHFPGHGDTREDSHLELPTVEADAAALDAALQPFRAAVDAGVRAIMTAHIRVPAIDDAPATLSRVLVDGMLRGELGFTGVVVSDALEMRGVSAATGIDEAAVRSLTAGADALILGHDVGEDELARVHEAVVAAVADGRLAEERLADAAGRVAALGRWTAEHAAPASPNGGIGAAAARRALAAEGDVRLVRPPLVVELVPEPTIAAGPSGHTFADAVRRRGGSTAEAVVLTSPPDPTPAVGERQLVLVLRDAHRYAWERETADAILATAPDAIVVETGIPAWRPAGVTGFLATHGAGRVNFDAAVERLLG
jgi:beta-N-acetylhexosaminidase